MLEFSVPAMFVAGLAASPQCGLMCGGLQQMAVRGSAEPMWRPLVVLHGGRILGYALLGALMGGGGFALLYRLPSSGLGLFAQIGAVAVLVVLAVRAWRRPASPCCRPRATVGGARHFGFGMAWALVPCASLYLALAAAALSGSALQGALLLVAFGLGTTPLLATSAWGLRRIGAGSTAHLSTALLLLVGMIGLVAAGSILGAASLWCAPR